MVDPKLGPKDVILILQIIVFRTKLWVTRRSFTLHLVDGAAGYGDNLLRISL